MELSKLREGVFPNIPGRDGVVPAAIWRLALIEGLRTLEEEQLELLETMAEAQPMVASVQARDALQAFRAVLEEDVYRIEIAFARKGKPVRRRLCHRTGPFLAGVLCLLSGSESCFGRDVVLATMLGGALSRIMMQENELLALSHSCGDHEITHVLQMAIREQRGLALRLQELAGTEVLSVLERRPA